MKPTTDSFVRPTLSAAQGCGNMSMWPSSMAPSMESPRAVAWGGWLIRLTQSGQTQHYALGMTLGAVVILTVYLLQRL